MYLICDNGYLQWPTSIYPYSQADNSTVKGYFSTNLESVRKNIDCTFGIKKTVEGAESWVQILQDGAMRENIYRMMHPS